jgi:SAM-dependent methyltransferase
LDLQDKLVLDIGCAIGGFDVLLAQQYGPQVIGLDVEAHLLDHGRKRVVDAGLSDRIDLQPYDPGPLPFPNEKFDVVFSKDSWMHIKDKHGLFTEVFRVLKPGGILTAGDWLRSDRPYNDDMYYFILSEGLTYHLDTLENYGAILRETGFVDVNLVDIHDEYQAMVHEEYKQLQTTFSDILLETLGEEGRANFIEVWRALVVVVDASDLRPGRFRARKPKVSKEGVCK